MIRKFTARLYLGSEEYLVNSSDDVEELHLWLLTEANGILGDIHGEIIDNTTQMIVKKFKKNAFE